MDWTLRTLVVGSTIAVLVFWVYGAIYDLFLGPLVHVPGTFWSRVSYVPSFYHAYKRDRHVWMWQLFEQYGDTIRITPTSVVFKSANAYRDIYGAKANVTRAKTYEIWQRAEHDVNTLNTSDVEVHRIKRRLLNLAFTEKSLQSAQEFIIHHVDRWHKILSEIGEPGEWSSPVNIADYTDYLSFDIMGDLSFGVQFNSKEHDGNRFRDVPHAVHEYMKFTYPITKSPLLPFLLWAKPRGLNTILNAIAPQTVKDYYKFIEESVAKRRKALSDAKEKGAPTTGARPDLFHYLCEARHPDHGGPAYNDQELLAEANLLIIAGSDTTSIQLSGFFFYITHNQYCYEKIIAEIRGTFASVESICSSPQLASCTYMRACLDEAMRLTPAGPAELGRMVLPGGQIIDGHYYPEGVIVGASMWCSGRHEDLGDPLVYRPERWIPDPKTGVTEDHVRLVKSFVRPFSSGPANCVGQNLAMLELLITIGRTLWRFDIRNTPGSTLGEGRPTLGWGRRDAKQYMVEDCYTSGRSGPSLQFRLRNDGA